MSKQPEARNQPGQDSYAHRTSNRTHTAQRAHLLAWLQTHHQISTFTARRELDIPHPAGRIRELRKAGHYIVTEWVFEETQHGHPLRKNALYVLLTGRAA